MPNFLKIISNAKKAVFTTNIWQNSKIKLLVVSLVIFVVLLPVSLLVDFHQNDDWCYYATVERFASGNFTLHPYVGPTFYLQGFLGLIFSNVFGLVRLPVLTLLMACAGLYIFMLILHEFLHLDLKWTVIVGFLYLVNPLVVYELWGYMTGHYFMFFLFLGLYFFLRFEESNKKKDFLIYVLASFAGLLVRQVSLVTPLAVAIYYFLKRKWQASIVNFVIFAAFYYFYSKILLLTPRMLEIPLQFQHFGKFDYMYALLYGTFLVLTAYLVPLILNLFATAWFIKNKRGLIFVVITAVGLYLLLNPMFKPNSVSWNEFPYFENVVERTGFYPRGVHGTKYYFAGNYDLWKYWDLGAKVLLALLLAYLIKLTGSFFKSKLRQNNVAFELPPFVNIYSVYIIVYMMLMVVTETYYDRYILTAVPLSILFLLSIRPVTNRITLVGKALLVSFVIFLGYLSYLFSADFILVNRYIWHRSIKIVQEKNIPPELITGTNAWKLSYRNPIRNYRYNFSYDSPQINQTFKEKYRLLEVKEIDFPLNIFVNSRIYLYEIL